MVPKKIHYCWFGRGPKSELIGKCIKSWSEVLSDYQIIEWNEDNFNVAVHPFCLQAYTDRKWAFVSDYARLWILKNEGGIYLDTDMLVLKSFNDFLDFDLVLGKEDRLHISAGMIAVTPKSPFIEAALEEYDKLQVFDNKIQYVTIPRVLSKVYDRMCANLTGIKVFESEYFYPFSASEIHDFNDSNAPENSYAVHMWDYSWGNPMNKLIKKIGIHSVVVGLLDFLGIKSFLKKIFKII